MKIGEAEVKTRKPERVLGAANYPVYETLNEALSHGEYGLGEVKLLELLNAQVKTNAMNQLRTAGTKGPSKTWARSEAMSEVVTEISNGEHTDCVGNRANLDALINKRTDEIIARAKAAAGVATADEEEEEEVEV